jgi:hypothetical protein
MTILKRKTPIHNVELGWPNNTPILCFWYIFTQDFLLHLYKYIMGVDPSYMYMYVQQFITMSCILWATRKWLHVLSFFPLAHRGRHHQLMYTLTHGWMDRINLQQWCSCWSRATYQPWACSSYKTNRPFPSSSFLLLPLPPTTRGKYLLQGMHTWLYKHDLWAV